MKRQLLSFLLVISAFSFQTAVCTAQTELTADQAKTLYKTTSKRRVSIHDPSVVYNEQNQRYYIFGSHKVGAYTTDMQNWTQANPTWNKDNSSAFTTPAVKTVKRGDKDVAFPAFNAMEWSARTDANYDINGNLWAPDVLWNPDMQKWCMYLSINGDAWHSSIVLLTADIITGPYTYQGPVVICGFQDSGHSYKDTDLELVIGTQSSLPTRYNVGNNKWGNRWPHTIDPSAFYDENGKLWLVYGSWSGGIWMLELDETTGLRDYNIAYPSTNGTSDGVTSDPYFGKKIGGGYYVSGEGPYIEHIGQYYFLFVSYGGFAPDGGYEMRVFRSENPDGPYKDIYNRSAIFSSYALNYGAGNDNRGEKLMGAYNGWGFQTVGECAQGHNSAIAAPDGRTYLVYHTKFNDGTAGHQVRVHQLFLNKQGWLVASPFEYNGETLTDDDIAQGTACQRQHIAGTYHLLVHKYKMDHANFEEQTPVKITLNDDGTVSGAYTGAWSVDEGTNYISIRLASTTYNGVVFEQLMDQRSVKSIAFTATANSGVNIWGYKMHPQYELAWHLNNQKVPITNNTTVRRNYDLYGMRNDELDNVSLQWTSSQPDIISNYGRYNPNGLDDDTPITLAARLTCADYFWAQDYNVTAASLVNSQSQEEWKTGMLAHYGFDNGDMHNTLNPADEAQLLRNGTTAMPTTVDGDPLRNGSVLHLNFGANGSESYAVMPNPLYGQALENGATISFYVKRTDNNLWDTLFGLVDGNARLYMTGKLYIGYNNNAGKWLDINHPTSVQPTQLTVNRWHLVTITFSRTASRTGGINIYVDGTKSTDKYNGELNGKTVTAKADFDYEAIVDHLAACQQLWFGRGSFWGSADAMYDHVMVHDHVLKTAEVLALYQMTNRVFDPATLRPDSGLVGDVNNDGEVGIGDIVAITNVMAGIETDTATISRADVNGDTEVGIGDIVAITNIMAGVSQ